MNDRYDAEQNRIYSEDYKALEYNVIEVEQPVSEYYVAPDNDFTAQAVSAAAAKKNNTLVSSTLLSSSGILAGVTVIVSAVIAMLLLNISVLSYALTPISKPRNVNGRAAKAFVEKQRQLSKGVKDEDKD